MIRRVFLLLSFLWVAKMLHANGVTFPSALLRRSAEALDLQNLDSISEGMTIMEDTRYGKLRITKQRGTIIHLGRQLFDSSLYGNGEIPVFDYLEFAALDHKFHISDNPYLYHTLQFKSGDWSMFDSVSPDTPCRVVSRENCNYEVSWQLPYGELSVTIPVDYDHLSLMSRREIETLFLNQLSSYKNTGRQEEPISLDNIQRDSRGMYTLCGQYYLLSTINDNHYYQINNDGNFVLVCDVLHPSETMANLVNVRSSSLPVASMDIRFDVYDSQSYRLRLPLSDFLLFCEQQGCHAFWGQETVHGTKVNGTIFLYNGKAGYNHVVHIKVDVSELLESMSEIEARACLFVPVHNIESFANE